MEEKIMQTIYNSLFDAKHELGIEDLDMYVNLEQNLVIRYKCNDEEFFITNEVLCI